MPDRPQFTRRSAQVVPGGAMTPAQFFALAELMRTADSTRTAAHAVLVNGDRAVDAAAQAGITQQSLSRTLARFRRAHRLVSDAYHPSARQR